MSQLPFFHDASSSAFENARQLRKNMTSAEKELWKHIRKDQLDGFRFRRQHPVAQFILDFYCHDSRLAIELDGSVHDSEDQKQYDQERDHIIHELGIMVLRFKNEEVFKNLNSVLEIIRMQLRTRLQSSRKSSLSRGDLDLSEETKSSPEGEDLGGVKGKGANS